MTKTLIAKNETYFDEIEKKYKNGTLYKVETDIAKGFIFKSDEGFIYPIAVKNRYQLLKSWNKVNN